MCESDIRGPIFRPGDRVQYRDGGPVMHVISASAQLCYCNWVDDFGILQRGTFEQRNLTHALGSDPAPEPPA